MITLGLDLSLTATGCIYLKDGKSIERSLLLKIKPTSRNPIEEMFRLLQIRDEIDLTGVDMVVIEGLAFMARNTSALVQLAGLNYLVRELLIASDVPFVIVPPTTLKKFVAGKGNCPKELMLLETYKRYNVSFDDNNLCDAYGLAQIGEAIINREAKLTKFQEEVLKTLKLQYE